MASIYFIPKNIFQNAQFIDNRVHDHIRAYWFDLDIIIFYNLSICNVMQPSYEHPWKTSAIIVQLAKSIWACQ